MTPQNFDGNSSGQDPAKHPRRGGRRKWWAICGGALIIILAIAAVIAIPQILHAQRVATYQGVTSQTDSMVAETHRLRISTDLTTVLYSLQFAEASEFQDSLETLSTYTDHYFTDAGLAALEEANTALVAVVNDEGLNDAEIETVARAKASIEESGTIWQTGYLNLTPDAMEQVIEIPVLSPLMRVVDEEVTDEVLEDARATLNDAETLFTEAERLFDAAQARAASLTEAVTGALEPLSSAAGSAPAQVDVVLGMYPNTDQDTTNLLRNSASVAAASVTAYLFTVDDLYLAVPASPERAGEEVSFEVTDAWRAVIIAKHLNQYSGAITAAWLSDRGGIEEVLRDVNPFLPFG